jgi:FtsZ-interacting cell division protein ZipA
MTKSQKQVIKQKAKEISDSMETLEFIVVVNMLYEIAMRATKESTPDNEASEYTVNSSKPLEGAKQKAEEIAANAAPSELMDVIIELYVIAKKRAGEYFKHRAKTLRRR